MTVFDKKGTVMSSALGWHGSEEAGGTHKPTGEGLDSPPAVKTYDQVAELVDAEVPMLADYMG